MKPSKYVINHRKTCLSTMLCCAISFPNLVLADTADEDDYLDAVVVTASRIEESLYKASSSIGVIDNKEIEESAPSTFAETVNKMPNVEVTSENDPFSSRISIRGSDSNEITYLIDGMRQDDLTLGGNRPLGLYVDPEMIKKVEVKRGGGASLYGNGGIGGTLAVETKDAKDLLRDGESFGATVKGGYSSANLEWKESAFLYGENDSVDAVLGFSHSDSGKSKTSRNGERGKGFSLDNDGASAMAKVSFKPNDDMKLGLSYNYDGNDSHTRYDDQSYDKYKLIQHRLGFLFDYVYGDYVDLKAKLQYSHSNVDYESDIVRNEDTYKAVSGNLQNTSLLKLLGEHALTYGGDFSTTKQFGKTRNPGNTLMHDDPARPDSKGFDGGLFIQDEYQLNDFLTVTPVLRYSYYERKSNNGYDSSNDSKFTPGITSTLKINDNVAFWASANKGFRPPILDEMYYSGESYETSIGPWTAKRISEVKSNPNLKAETSNNYEAGINLLFDNLLLSDDHFRFKGSIFYDKIKNMIKVISTEEEPEFSPPVIIYRSVYQTVNENEEVTRKGAELSAEYTAGGYEFKPSFGLVHAERDESHEKVNNITPRTAGLYNAYTFKGIDLKLWYQLKWRDGGTKEYLNADYETVTEHQGSFTTHSVGLKWTPSVKGITDLTFNIIGDNITDKHYRYLNGSTYNYGYGRNVRITFSARF